MRNKNLEAILHHNTSSKDNHNSTMANMDLLSYERDSRWMPHLSWTHLDWTLQQRMEQQAEQRELAWQRIADKLGPLLLAGSGCSFGGPSDYIAKDFEDLDFVERGYEKAPLLTTQIKHSNQKQSQPQPRYVDVDPPSSWTKTRSSSPISPKKQQKSQSQQQSPTTVDSGKANTTNGSNHDTTNYDCESLRKAKRRCKTVSTILIGLVLLLITIVILMSLGVLKLHNNPARSNIS